MKGYTEGFIVRDLVVPDQYYELYSYIEVRGANMGECWNDVCADRVRSKRRAIFIIYMVRMGKRKEFKEVLRFE